MATEETSNGVSRAALAAVAVVGLVVLGGAFVVLTTGGDSGPGTPTGTGDAAPYGLDAVPANNTTLVAYVDPAAVDDPVTESVVNTAINASQAGTGETGGVESYDDLLQQVRENASEEGLDVDVVGNVNYVTVFGSENPNDINVDPSEVQENEYAGVLVNSDWSEEELEDGLRQAYESDETERSFDQVNTTRYDEHKVYVLPSEEDEDTYLAVLGNGRYVFGTQNSVYDAVDAYEGEVDDAVDTLLGNTLEDAGQERTRVAVATTETDTEMTGSEEPQLDATAFSYTPVNDSAVAFDLVLEFPDNENATEGAEEIRQSLAESENSTGAAVPSVQDAIQRVEVTQDGETVRTTYEAPVEEFNDLVQLGVQLFASSFSGGTGAP